jgi:hypothetical protein
MTRPTVSLAMLRDAGVRFVALEDWVTLTQIADTLGLSYQGAAYLVLDQQVFDLTRDVRLAGERLILVRSSAFAAYRLARGTR